MISKATRFSDEDGTSGCCVTGLRRLLAQLPLSILVVLCLTLGLAPFLPEPHIWEKLKMLASGTLTRPIDIFDMLFHGVPWILLLLKLTLGRQSNR